VSTPLACLQLARVFVQLRRIAHHRQEDLGWIPGIAPLKADEFRHLRLNLYRRVHRAVMFCYCQSYRE
jgi:hypothetical protein